MTERSRTPRTGLFARLRSRYYTMRRRNMRAHSEKFRHVTVRRSTPGYRALMWLRRSTHYVKSSLAAVLSFVSPVFLPLLALLMIGGSFWFFSNYTVALAVELDDTVLGYVASSDEYDLISDRVEDQVKKDSLREMGKEVYLVEAFPSLRYAVIPKGSYTPQDDLYDSLYTLASDYLLRSYGLFLDGELVATSRDRADIEKAIDTVLEAYRMSDEDNLEIINYMEIIYGEYDASYSMGYSRILDLFRTGPSLKGYEVKRGDTLASISAESGISIPVLRLLNGMSYDYEVQAGQTIMYGKPYRELTVKNTLNVYTTEPIGYQTEYVNSSDHFKGTQTVLRNGSDGVYEVLSHIVYVNGSPSATMEVSRTVIKQAVSRQIMVGTKTIAPSGEFIFPLKSYSFISSRFGWRWLRGQRNFHRGLDIAASRGTTIYAADTGTVSDVGYETGGLGYFVKIDHGNGIITIYGHCYKKPHVSKGQTVYQGQDIAYVGSTGNSTGNHLHFGVYNKKTGEYLDPEKYLP